MRIPILGLAVILFAGVPAGAADDLTTSYNSLKEAVAAKDAALVKKLAQETHALAREVIAAPDPEDADQKETLAKRKTFAAEVDSYVEYSLFATAVQSEPATLADLMKDLETLNPKSKYLAGAYGCYFAALLKQRESAKIVEIAGKAIVHFPNCPDLLMVLADHALTQKQTARAGSYAEKTITAFTKQAKPETVSAADWERMKSLALGRAFWIAGLAHGEKNEHFQCDKDFKAALPYFKDNPQMLAPALFYLGVSNYYLGRSAMNHAQILEGSRYSEQCSKIPGPYQRQAWTNAHLMKTEADKLVLRK
ncbi:MAG: hypothetical protein IH602_21390 [Bryobacteraceae bacterium]|nr:hypothetical protein [Bryobacteraceae bacterium]